VLSSSASFISGSAQPFFPDAQPAGQVAVKLFPTEGVTTGTPVLVSLGIPFPRGSVTIPQLANVRVLNAQQMEVAAHVSQLTPWRHAVDAQLDGTSVRVARIQFRHTFITEFPANEGVIIEWGGAARTMDVAAWTDARTAWHPVTTGSFVAADGVQEPDVYAVLPPALLSSGVLRSGPMLPFASSVTEARDDPAVMDATEHYAGTLELDHAQKNFFYTHVHQDDPAVMEANQIPYKTDGEPWLYDRASAFYVLYLRTGFFSALREAVRASEFYRVHLYPPGTTPDDAVGAFDLKTPAPTDYIGANGTMYCYSENMAYTYWLTADDDTLDSVPWISKVHEDATDEDYRWTSGTGYTERHVAFRGLAHTIAFELLGDVPYKPGEATYKELLLAYADNLVWHQDGAGGAVPSPHVDGALWKYGRQQGDGPETEWVANAWMMPIVTDSMLRVYAVTGRADVAAFMRRAGTFLVAATKVVDDPEFDSGMMLRAPDYITLIDGSTYAPDGTTGEHALEVAAALGWAYYFSVVTGQPQPQFRDAANQLYLTYDYSVNFWTRPAAPASGVTAYRVNPPRKYNWQYRPSGSFSWLMAQ